MNIRASEVKVGQRIKFEYGDYGNWVTGTVGDVKPDGNYICISVSSGGRAFASYFNKYEPVQVLED